MGLDVVGNFRVLLMPPVCARIQTIIPQDTSRASVWRNQQPSTSCRRGVTFEVTPRRPSFHLVFLSFFSNFIYFFLNPKSLSPGVPFRPSLPRLVLLAPLPQPPRILSSLFEPILLCLHLCFPGYQGNRTVTKSITVQGMLGYILVQVRAMSENYIQKSAKEAAAELLAHMMPLSPYCATKYLEKGEEQKRAGNSLPCTLRDFVRRIADSKKGRNGRE